MRAAKSYGYRVVKFPFIAFRPGEGEWRRRRRLWWGLVRRAHSPRSWLNCTGFFNPSPTPFFWEGRKTCYVGTPSVWKGQRGLFLGKVHGNWSVRSLRELTHASHTIKQLVVRRPVIAVKSGQIEKKKLMRKKKLTVRLSFIWYYGR